MSTSSDETYVVPGRSCGGCSLCCKLLRIDAFNKPSGNWCPHCKPGHGGCAIYENRPPECRTFYCLWLTSANLGAEWRPNKCKMVLQIEASGQRTAVHVDPGAPTVWRQEPFFRQLKELAVEAARNQQQVVVYIRDRTIVILPDKEVDLGIMQRGDHIMVRHAADGTGWGASIKPAKDVDPEDANKWTTTKLI
jgi:hypothetical protein